MCLYVFARLYKFWYSGGYWINLKKVNFKNLKKNSLVKGENIHHGALLIGFDYWSLFSPFSIGVPPFKSPMVFLELLFTEAVLVCHVSYSVLFNFQSYIIGIIEFKRLYTFIVFKNLKDPVVWNIILPNPLA